MNQNFAVLLRSIHVLALVCVALPLSQIMVIEWVTMYVKLLVLKFSYITIYKS